MKKIINTESLEEGKTYHVLVGDENNPPTERIIEEIKENLYTQFKKFKWLVTPYFIKIGDKPDYISKEKIEEVITNSQVDESGKGDFVIGDVKKFKEELGLM